MNLTHLSVFIEVLHEGSFAKVAKKRSMSPSTVSRVIASLEEEANVRLFERNTRNMEPTEQAFELQEKLEPLLEEINTSFIELSDKAKIIKGNIRVTSTVSFGLTHLVPAITQFSNLYPAVEVDFHMTDHQVDIINERIDVAFRFGHLDDSNFISQKLMPLKYFACASKKYIQKNGCPTKPGQISQHNCLSFLMPHFMKSWKFKKNGQSRVCEYPIKGNLKISNAVALRDAALRGHGIALLPEFLIKEDLNKGRLIDLFPDFDITASKFDSAIWIVYPSRKYLPKRTRAFIDFTKDWVLNQK